MTAATFAAVVVAGAAGAVARAALTTLLARLAGGAVPATIAVNLVGAFLAGALTGAADGPWATVTAVGFLGAFTTFSTWVVQAHARWRAGARGAAALALSGPLVLGVAVAALGRALVG